MSRYQYTEIEKQLNRVLLFQDEKIKAIEFPDSRELNEQISESESILKEFGYNLPDKQITDEKQKPIMVLPSWEKLCKEAEEAIDFNVELEELFTKKELEQNSIVIRQLNDDYNNLHKLDKNDIAICVIAGLIGATVDILMVGIPEKTPEGLSAGTLANHIRKSFNERFPEEEMAKLANSKVSKVPYDAQDNRNTTQYVEGLSAYYHRLLSIGHDPILGLIFGVVDILSGRMTTIDKTGHIVSQVMENYADRKEQHIFEAISKQLIHLKSDITTSMGLPAPLMALFNLLQFGSIGEEELTVAEIVQGMYYEGFDFIHFCAQSIPVMIIEIVVRLGYAIKRIKEGYSIKDSIPISLNREKHPKLATMLFVGHSVSSAVNAGQVYFTKNPMAINYPQWLAFAKYSFSQMKWVLIQKPELQDRYVTGRINQELDGILGSANQTFNDISKNYIVVME